MCVCVCVCVCMHARARHVTALITAKSNWFRQFHTVGEKTDGKLTKQLLAIVRLLLCYGQWLKMTITTDLSQGVMVILDPPRC